MEKKLIIFDCDGVLVDSEYIASCIFSEALTEYGYQISVEESIKKFTGVSEHDARQLIAKEASIDIPENYWTLLLPKLHQAYATGLTSLMQPVLETLALLKISRCVASNSPRSHVTNCLHLSKQANFFKERAIFTSQQVAKPKPAPDLFLFAANEMGFQPEECIVIEDSPAGTQAAIDAGMDVLIFLGGSHASYDWYKDIFTSYNRPIASSCQELLEVLGNAIELGNPTLQGQFA